MAKADAVEVEFSGGERSATRFANSNITANMVQYDRNLSVTVYVGTRSATASTRDFDDASLKTAVDDAQKRAQEARENPEALPLIEGPQEYITVDAALPSGVNFGPAERARMVKQSLDICQKKGVIGSGYIPKTYQTTCTANSKGLFAYYQYGGGELHPDVPHQGRRRLRLGGFDRHQGHQPDQRHRADRDRLRQGAQEPEAARDRARTLHDHPRAARQRPVPVADDRPLQRPHGGRPGRQLLQRETAGNDEGRREAVQRRLHAQERHRQPVLRQTPIGIDGMAGEAGDVDREGRAEEALLRPRLGQAAEEGPDTDEHQPEPGDGRLGHDGRADDQDHQARPAGDLLLVHPRRRSRRRCSTPA